MAKRRFIGQIRDGAKNNIGRIDLKNHGVGYCLISSEINDVFQHLFGGPKAKTISKLELTVYSAHLAVCPDCCERIQDEIKRTKAKAKDIHTTYEEEIHRFDQSIPLYVRMMTEFYPSYGDD